MAGLSSASLLRPRISRAGRRQSMVVTSSRDQIFAEQLRREENQSNRVHVFRCLMAFTIQLRPSRGKRDIDTVFS